MRRRSTRSAGGAASARALARCARALGACPEEAVTLLGEALTLLAGGPTRLEQARCKVELGAALRRAGERAAARPVLTAGLERARACGALGLTAERMDDG